MLSNCGHDENNCYSGGRAGDQTGTEYRLIPWYEGGWDEAFVHPDADIRSTVADAGTKAALNDHIGYDQSQRLTYFRELKAAAWHPESIKADCEADCSSSSAANVIAAGYRCGDRKLQAVNPACVTGNIGAALVAAGFIRLTESKYLRSPTYLPKGTVLNRSSGHVVIVTTDGTNASETLAAIGIWNPAGAAAGTVRAAQEWLISQGFGCGPAGADGVYGADSRRAAARCVQKALNACGAALKVDGCVGKLTKLAYQSYGPVKKGCMSYSLTRSIQAALMLHGFSAGSGGIDGDCGPDTVAAIKAFQASCGLAADGIAGKDTFARLFT